MGTPSETSFKHFMGVDFEVNDGQSHNNGSTRTTTPSEDEGVRRGTRDSLSGILTRTNQQSMSQTDGDCALDVLGSMRSSSETRRVGTCIEPMRNFLDIANLGLGHPTSNEVFNVDSTGSVEFHSQTEGLLSSRPGGLHRSHFSYPSAMRAGTAVGDSQVLGQHLDDSTYSPTESHTSRLVASQALSQSEFSSPVSTTGQGPHAHSGAFRLPQPVHNLPHGLAESSTAMSSEPELALGSVRTKIEEVCASSEVQSHAVESDVSGGSGSFGLDAHHSGVADTHPSSIGGDATQCGGFPIACNTEPRGNSSAATSQIKCENGSAASKLNCTSERVNINDSHVDAGVGDAQPHRSHESHGEVECTPQCGSPQDSGHFFCYATDLRYPPQLEGTQTGYVSGTGYESGNGDTGDGNGVAGNLEAPASELHSHHDAIDSYTADSSPRVAHALASECHSHPSTNCLPSPEAICTDNLNCNSGHLIPCGSTTLSSGPQTLPSSGENNAAAQFENWYSHSARGLENNFAQLRTPPHPLPAGSEPFCNCDECLRCDLMFEVHPQLASEWKRNMQLFHYQCLSDPMNDLKLAVPYVENMKLPLGEHGRTELKSTIRDTLRTRPELREEVNGIAKLKCATIPQLLKMASLCGLWDEAVRISETFVRSKEVKQSERKNHQLHRQWKKRLTTPDLVVSPSPSMCVVSGSPSSTAAASHQSHPSSVRSPESGPEPVFPAPVHAECQPHSSPPPPAPLIGDSSPPTPPATPMARISQINVRATRSEPSSSQLKHALPHSVAVPGVSASHFLDDLNAFDLGQGNADAGTCLVNGVY